MSRCFCRGLQEVECAFLFSPFLQCRAAQRFPDTGDAAGLRYTATFPVLWFCKLNVGDFILHEQCLWQVITGNNSQCVGEGENTVYSKGVYLNF